MRLAAALILFFYVRGYFREGRTSLEAALSLEGKQPAAARSRALWGLGFMALMLQDHPTARDALEKALEAARVDGGPVWRRVRR